MKPLTQLFPPRRQSSSFLYEWDGEHTRDLALAECAMPSQRLPAKRIPDATTTAICGYCSTGCSLMVHLKDGQAFNLSGDPRHPVNKGMACPKGWEALSPLDSPNRATQPLLRDKRGKLRPASWDEAMTHFCGRLKEIQTKRGLDSIAWLGTGQIPIEELALLGVLGKFGMNIRHGDGNTRQCMATAATAYKESFGFDAPPYTYRDFEESDALIFIGSNPCIAHPIMWQRVMSNSRRPKIVVVDPRKTETAMQAHFHYALRPKSDLFLLYGLARLLIEKQAVDHEFVARNCRDFERFSAFTQQFTLTRTSEATGLSRSEIEEFAHLISSNKRVSFWWTMGVNQSHEGVRTAQAIINLALMTGNIGKPGTGANSITGQCNAMGSRLFSNTTNLLGGRDFANPVDRNDVAKILGIDVSSIPETKGLAYDQIIEGIEDDRIKALWVVATNSSHSWIGSKRLEAALEKLDFLVVQDMFHNTDTATNADLVLPAAAWGEKDGVFINSERRLGRVRKIKQSPGAALSDFNIFRLIAKYWGCSEMLRNWDSPESVFRILTELTRGLPCDLTGIKGYDCFENGTGLQWPYPEGNRNTDSERRLFEDGRFFHTDGKARFIFEEPRPLLEPVRNAYPFVLLTGRGSSAQWHTQTRTSQSEVLQKLYSRSPYVEINRHDAERLSIADNQFVQVSSRRGRARVRARISPSVQEGHLFMPMHYKETNTLTLPAFDPYSRQPSYKHCPVSIRAES